MKNFSDLREMRTRACGCTREHAREQLQLLETTITILELTKLLELATRGSNVRFLHASCFLTVILLPANIPPQTRVLTLSVTTTYRPKKRTLSKFDCKFIFQSRQILAHSSRSLSQKVSVSDVKHPPIISCFSTKPAFFTTLVPYQSEFSDACTPCLLHGRSPGRSMRTSLSQELTA